MKQKDLSKFTQITAALAVVFLVYGYSSRMIGIPFFWESKPIGWTIFFIALISFLSDRIRFRKPDNTILEKIGIGFAVFILFLRLLLVVIIAFSDAYVVAKDQLLTKTKLPTDLGEIEGFGIIPAGSIQTETVGGVTTGSVTINLILKGSKKYRETTVHLVKEADNPNWQVVKIQ